MGNSFSTTSTGEAGQVTLVPPGTFVTSVAASAAGYYASRQDVEDVFGRDNVTTWSQLDNDATVADPRRIGQALAYADALINDIFRGGPYTVPLVLNSGQATVRHWAAVIAGTWLYENRGQRDRGPDGNQYTLLLARVQAQMLSCKAQVSRLDAVTPTNMPTGPTLARHTWAR